ncbi:MAG: heavy metal translocating P-type ATPase [Pseudomonadota bacterium]
MRCPAFHNATQKQEECEHNDRVKINLATVTGSGQVYFDSVVMFTFFLLLGRFLERRARHLQDANWWQAQDALPDAVSVQREDSWVAIPRMQVNVGDRILVPAGATVPIDACVTAGESAVREDAFNGEYQPRTVVEGDTVFAGTINVENSLQARVVCTYRDSRLAELQRSVDRGQAQKPALARLADRVASWFIAAILLISIATWLVWHQLAPEQAFWIMLSVLVISCPCALALATPAALASAAGALRRNGIIIRSEDALESLSRSKHLIFDKTGTLTSAELVIDSVVTLNTFSEQQVLEIAAALQAHSRHPVSGAFKSLRMAKGMDQVSYHVGAGLQGELSGETYRIGSESFCRTIAPSLPYAPSTELYWVALCRDEKPLAWIGLRDRVRPEATSTVQQAMADGFCVELLTGDSSNNGALMAQELGLSHYACGLRPEQKMTHVETLQQSGLVVTMVGDGLNDAPVLSLADVSFAVASAADLASAQADFILLRDDLNLICVAYKKARQCRRVMLQNISWALGYNICAIPLAAMGFVPPWLAAVGMSASSLLVVLNSLRLSRVSAETQWRPGHG